MSIRPYVSPRLLPAVRARARRVTAASLIDSYLAFARHDLAPVTFRIVRRYLVDMRHRFGGRRAASLGSRDVWEWIASRPRWRAADTVATVIRIVRRAWRWAVAEGIIARDPFGALRKPRGESRRPLTRDEFRRALRVAPAHMRRAMMFLRWTGCRVGEMRLMRWGEVDDARGCVVLARHKTRRTQRGERPRIIPLPAVAGRLLAWTSEGIARLWGRVRTRAGIASDARLYGLRHAYVTDAVRAGAVGVHDLAAIMGHASIATTMRYVHLAGDVEHLRRAAEKAVAGCNTPTGI